MFCKKCGGKLESYASHCAFCGEKVEKYDANTNYIKQERNDNNEHMTVAKWIGFTFVNAIPFVGQIIYFVLLFKWAFGSTKDLTLKNYARANLIIIAISIILLVLLVVLYSTIFVSYLNEFKSYIQ